MEKSSAVFSSLAETLRSNLDNKNASLRPSQQSSVYVNDQNQKLSEEIDAFEKVNLDHLSKQNNITATWVNETIDNFVKLRERIAELGNGVV